MPAGNVKVLEKVMDSIADVTNDFIVLSVHDDVDILVRKENKSKIMQVLDEYNFRGHVNGNPDCLYYAEPNIQYFDSNKCHIDLQTGLYYHGFRPNTLIPIDIQFQNYVFDTRVKTGNMWRYRLSPESNVVHTICRIVFDKKKTPPHYKDRLIRCMKDCDSDELLRAFNMTLFKFGKKAHELVLNGEFDNIAHEYITYMDY
tara:strand:- start:9263 stop:9865 length:603 start_codon:yes stop_codon:yes gene_type:complete